jgi:hypothetical protein
MATKTIALELDAYEKLERAKREPGESFSSVVRRARWDEVLGAGQILTNLRELHRLDPQSLLDDEALDQIEERALSRGRRTRAEAGAG